MAALVACGGTSRHSSSSTAGTDAGGGRAGGSSAGAAHAGAAVAEAGSAGAMASSAAGTGGMLPEPVDPFEGTTDAYWTQVVQTELARQQECFGVPADYVMLGSDVVSARFLIERQLEQRLRDVQPSIDAGRVRFDRQAAADCLQRLQAQSCDDLLLDLAHGDQCVDKALIGLVALGGVCAQAIDCSDPNQVCYGRPPSEPRVCTPLSGPGQSCDFIGCAPGNECEQTGLGDFDNPTFTCAARLPAVEGQACGAGGCLAGLSCVNQVCRDYRPDAPCASNIDCLYLQACLRDPTGTSGRCGRPRAEGESCQGTPAENDCAFSFDCRANTQGKLVCTSVWAHVGELCRNTGGNGGIVCIDGYCDVISSANQQGVCVASAKLGEDCSSGICEPGLECTETGCQPESD